MKRGFWDLEKGYFRPPEKGVLRGSKRGFLINHGLHGFARMDRVGCFLIVFFFNHWLHWSGGAFPENTERFRSFLWGSEATFWVYSVVKWGLEISRVEHKEHIDFLGGGCVHSHFMKSECELGVRFGAETFVPFFMKSGLEKFRGGFNSEPNKR